MKLAILSCEESNYSTTRLVTAAQQRGHDVTRLVQVALGALAGRELAEIEALGQEIWRTKIAGKVYPDARRLVTAHLRAGHTVALASSATRFQAEAAAADLDIEHLLVTEIEDPASIQVRWSAGWRRWAGRPSTTT